jgi:hypothetical protein
MVGIHQLDQHFVLSGRHPSDIDGVEVARVRPQPRQVIDADV